MRPCRSHGAFYVERICARLTWRLIEVRGVRMEGKSKSFSWRWSSPDGMGKVSSNSHHQI